LTGIATSPKDTVTEAIGRALVAIRTTLKTH